MYCYLWAQGREVGAGGGTRFVGAIGTIAVVVVDTGEGECLRGIGYASEGCSVFVELGDCRVVSVGSSMAGIKLS